MKWIALLFLIVVMPFFSYGQGCITILSEDYNRFYLLINGEKQNASPESNVRIDGLLNDSYNVRIIFEDQAKTGITKTIKTKDASGKYQESEFEIKNKEGSLVLVLLRTSPVPPTYSPSPGMYYGHFGQAATNTVTVISNGNNAGNGGASISIIPGGGTNTPEQSKNSKEAEVAFSFGQNDSQPAHPAAPVHAVCPYPMDPNRFKTAKQTIAQASFEDTKLSTAESILASDCLSTDQVMEICKLFGIEESKLKFAKFAYPKTTDPDNYIKAGKVFEFNATKTDLSNFINNGGR